MKRFLSILLSVALMLSLLPLNIVSVGAEQGEEAAQSPTKRETVTYTEITALPTASGYYKLTQDITGSKSYSSAVEITIDLNGHSITASNNGRIFRLSNGAKLTVLDSSEGKTGRLHPAESSAQKGSIAGMFKDKDDTAKPSLTLENVTVDGLNRTAGGTGGAFDIETGTFTMNGGAIVNCISPNGGAIYEGVSGTKVELNGVEIKNNAATNNGGAIYVANGSLTIKGETIISGNEAKTAGGGGIFLSNNAELTMSSGKITGNTAKTGGGGIRADNGTNTVNITGGEISKNTAGGIGGGIMTNGTLNVKNAIISENTANGDYGGGIQVQGTSSLENTQIINNKAPNGKGGGIYVVAAVSLKDCTVSGNTAKTSGGGIELHKNTMVVTLDGKTTVTGNKVGDTVSNFSLLAGGTFKVGTLTDGAAIGITVADAAENRVVAADVTADVSAYFTDDTATYGVGMSGTDLVLGTKLTGISLSETSCELDIGGTKDLTVTFTPNAAINHTVRWMSNAESVATVDANGKIKAVGAGTATVTATAVDGGFTATCTVKVYADATGVTLNKNTLALAPNGTEQLTATVQPENARQEITWSTDKASVATVDASGKVTAVANGEAVITATAKNGKSASCNVSVSTATSGVHLDKTSLLLTVGKNATLTATVLPATASNRNVSWTSSDPETVSVTSGGVLTAHKVGKATITVTSDADATLKATCAVEVIAKHLHDGYACDCAEGGEWQVWTSTTSLPTASGYYYLYHDVTLASTMTELKNADVVLCLNGKTVTAKSGGRVYKLTGGASLTVCDCTATTVDGTYTAGKLVGGSAQGGCIWANAKNTFTLYDGILTGATDSAIFAWSGDKNAVTTVTMKGGLITGNASKTLGGAVQLNENNPYTVFKMEGGTITDNTATTNGGAIGGKGTIEITGGTITNNTATGNGGAVYANGATVTLTGCELSGNKAEKQAGALYVNGGTVTLKNCTVSGNTSGKEIAAIYAQGGAKLTLDGVSVTGNTCGTSGYGAVAIPNKNSTLTLKGKVVIKDNKTAAGAAQNLVIRDNVTVNVAELDTASEIHFTFATWEVGSVLSDNAGENDLTACFVSDRWGYAIEKRDGKLVLAYAAGLTPHTHDCDTEKDVEWTPWLENDSLPTENGHWVLTRDVNLTKVQAYGADKDIAICLNGYTVTQTAENARLLRISDGAKITVCDCTGEGKLTGGNLPEDKNTGSGGAVYVTGEGTTFTLLSGNLTGNTAGYHGGAIVCQSKAKVVIKGGSIANNEAKKGNGGAIWVSGATLELTGGELTENTASATGGAIHAENGATVTVGGAKLEKNRAANGGAVYTGGTATVLTLLGGASVAENEATSNGGGLYIANGSVTLKDASVAKNRAKGNGGGAYLANAASLTLTDEKSVLSENTAQGTGGGIYLNDGTDTAPCTAKLTVQNGKIADNTAATLAGGGIRANGKQNTVEITGGELSGNKAGTSGGAIFCNGTLTVKNATLSNNTAGATGGAVQSQGVSATLENVKLENNTATTNGGAIWANSVLTLENCTFKGNKAENGGAIYANGATVTLTGGELSGNRSEKQAGAVYASGGTVTLKNCTVSGNTSGTHIAAIYGCAKVKLTLDGVTVTGNTCGTSGYGAVAIPNNGSTLTLKGKVVIKDNKTAAGAAQNLVIRDDGNVTVGVAGLDTTSEICFTFNTWQFGKVLSEDVGENDPSACFVSDRANYVIAKKNGKLILTYDPKFEHVHADEKDVEWTPWLENNTLPKTSGHYVLTCDVELTTVQAYTGDVEIVLCLNGFTVKQTGKNVRLLRISDGAKFTVCDCTDKGKLTGGNLPDDKNTGSGGAVYVAGEGSAFTLLSGSITGNTAGRHGGAIVCQSKAELFLKGGTITGNTAGHNAGAIFVSGGKLHLTGTEITENTAGELAGGIYLSASTVGDALGEMTGGCIAKNESGSDGAGLYLSAGSFTVGGNAAIEGNASATAAGGVNVRGGATLTLSGGSISNNTAKNGAGIVVTTESHLVMNGGKVAGNKASNNGGGVYIVKGSTFEMTGGEISENTSENFAGGVYLGGDGKFTGGKITKNHSKNEGAGVYVGGENTMTLAGTSITENTTDGSAAGINVRGKGKLIMTDGTVSNNTSEKSGAGIVVTKESSFELSGGTVSGNRAKSGNGGGVYIVKGSTFEMNGGEISENTSENFAGGVYLGGDGKFTGGKITKNHSKNEGAGVYVGGENTMTLAGTSITENTTDGSAAGINVRGKGKLIMTDGTVSNNTSEKSGAGIVVTKESSFELSGGTVSGNRAKSGNGGGVYIVKGSSFSMYGGTVTGNSSPNFAGGIYLGGDGVFAGGTITKNHSKNEGAGVYVGGENTMTLSGTAITGNTSEGAAGGINVRGGATLVMNGGSVSNNKAEKSGAGIVITKESHFVFGGGTVSGNSAVTGSGGGIFVNTGCDILMSGGEVSGNTAAVNGGGLYVGGDGTFNGGVVCENTAVKEGGGLYLGGGNTVTLDGVKIAENKAASGGGVLARGKAAVTFASGAVTGNTADTHGGGFLFQSYATLSMTGGSITNNTAGNTGGGIRTTDNTFSILGGEISENTAGGQGGGIYTQGVASVIRDVTFKGNKANATSSSYQSIGGALLLGVKAEVTVENCTFSGNEAVGSGGAVGVWHTKNSQIVGCDFVGNETHSFGGAVYVSANADIPFKTCTVKGNTASTYGGAIYVDGNGVLQSSESEFTENTAANGGALYVMESGKAVMTDDTVSGNTAKTASAIYSSGTLELFGAQITGNKASDSAAVYLNGAPNDGLTMNSTNRLGGNTVIRDNDGGDAYITNGGVIFIDDSGLGTEAYIALRLESGLISDTVFGSYGYEKLEECSYLITAGTRSLTDPESAAPIELDASDVDAADEAETSNVLLYAAIGAGAVLATLVLLIVLLKRKKNVG